MKDWQALNAELTAAAMERLAWRRRHSGKNCRQCRETLPLSAFGLRASSPDGLKPYCRRCDATNARARRAKRNE